MIRVIGILCLFLVVACQSKSNEIRVIKEDKMIAIMADVYVLEMHYQKNYGSPISYKKHLDQALQKLFKSHGVNRASYEKSFTYYASKHAQFINMNEEVIQRYNTELLQK
ncbi:MAG: DUF4296 domain-containing protein [Flavobacteriales bacterium]